MSEKVTANQDEVESQLSAMFDGELPAAECELLSRRIDRDENLRARWARYALIGAAMRCEPVATARGDFAARVFRAVARAEGGRGASRAARRRHLLWQSALAAGLVGAVAGLSILMLRDVALAPSLRAALARVPAAVVTAASAPAVHGAAAAGEPGVAARQREAAQVLLAPSAAGVAAGRGEPWSYVTPAADGDTHSMLRTELVDYIVAHSEYSPPLVRSDLLSELISGDADEFDAPPAQPVAGR